VRARVLEQLPLLDLGPDADDPLLRDAFVHGMVVQHEHQHDETLLATIELTEREYPHPEVGVDRPAAPVTPRGFVTMPGGDTAIGTDSEPWAYDNERPAHVVALAPFRIGVAPVTNGEYAKFVTGGGYDDAGAWSERGWEWRREAGLEHPQGWRPEGGDAWSRLRFGARADLDPTEPVEHVCWYEADAFARWAGARLPTEPEWEAAARAGVLEATGRVWEWTASDFVGYPGFRSFPYREYSEVFFGDEYKVLRGGSWATHDVARRTTFRNWDFPIRRQIFSGLRLATEAA